MVLERLVQRQDLPRHLRPDGTVVIVVLNMGVALEQVNHREIRRGLAVGDGATFQDEPALGAMGLRELPEEPGLAHPGLADDRHHLALTGPGPLQRSVEGIQLGAHALQSA